MGAYRLIETAVSLIESHIRAQIATALANVRTERNDPIVTTEVPKEYFIFEKAHAYRAPAVFIIAEGQDFRNAQMGANHLNALDDIVVAVVVEDRIAARVTKKAWRYQAALVQILHETALTSSDDAVKLFLKVQRCGFSGLVDLKDTDTPEAVFRKEVYVRLEVEHIENLE